MTSEHFDVLVVGAGISGIGAGYHLQTHCPGKTYAIFEAREAIGGTWDLFRYPGVRSDSDMYTLGFAFRPWTEAKAIADGPSILNYVRETAAAFGIDKHIRFGRRVVRAAWASARGALDGGLRARPTRGARCSVTCGFLFMCAGYYNYAEGYTPRVRRRRAVHGPDRPPAGLARGPRLRRQAGGGDRQRRDRGDPGAGDGRGPPAHVTMLQRSPTYVVSRPAEDAFANQLRKRLPAKLAYQIVRWRNVLCGM